MELNLFLLVDQKPNSRTYNVAEVSRHNLEMCQDLRFPYTMFILQTSFKPFLLKRGGGGEETALEDMSVIRT
jgi:hypothetical protein